MGCYPLKLYFVAEGHSIHTRRWEEWFAQNGHEVHLISCSLMSGIFFGLIVECHN